MPKRTEGRRLFAEQHLARRVAMERERREWTYASLAKRTEDAGCAIAPSALWKIENPPEGKPRRITVDELVVLSQVFEIPMVDLVVDPAMILPKHVSALAERTMLAAHRVLHAEAEMNEAMDEWLRVSHRLAEQLEQHPDLLSQVESRVRDVLPNDALPMWQNNYEDFVFRFMRRAAERGADAATEDA